MTYWYVLPQPDSHCLLPLAPPGKTCIFFPWWLPPPYHIPWMPSFLFTWSHCHLQSEAIPESLKNMLLVMDTAEIFHNADARGGSPSALWEITWERIDCFLPHLRDELFKQTVIQGRRLSSTLLKRVPIKESRAKNQFSVLPSVGRLMGSQGYA